MSDLASLQKGLRVLVVDAAADSRDLLRCLFDAYEVETTTVTCVSEALASMAQTCPDLLISELFLPGEDGYSLIEKVKAFEVTHRVRMPALALTGCASEHERLRALLAGFCQHLVKPFDIDELLATVAHLTGQAPDRVASACA